MTPIEKATLQMVFDQLKAGGEPQWDNDTIKIDGRTIGLKIEPDFDDEKDGRYLYSAKITTTCSIFKQSSTLEYQSVGIGANREEAVTTCMREWFGAFAVALIRVVLGTANFTINGKRFYSGLMGVRGNVPPNTWVDGTDRMAAQVVASVFPVIGLSQGVLTPLDVKLVVEKEEIKVNCLIGSIVSKAAADRLQTLPWPEVEQPFMFKQYYIMTDLD